MCRIRNRKPYKSGYGGTPVFISFMYLWVGVGKDCTIFETGMTNLPASIGKEGKRNAY
jgi:hypothetical protein